MKISVWADVGGTFTDCIVRTEDSRSETKVLSSGRVRTRVVALSAPNTLIVESLTGDTIDGFWKTAHASVIDSSSQELSLGKVQSLSRGEDNLTQVVLDANLEELKLPAVLELDADLEAPVLAARLLLGVPITDALPPLEVRLGTTRGTNALLTRSGAKTALLVTAGFRDVLRIGEQDRPDLFALAIKKHPPLTNHTLEVVERLDAKGAVLEPIDLARLRADLAHLREQGIESLSICLLHGYLNPIHEIAVEDIASELGFVHLSRSSEVAPLIKLVSRAETTTLDAYLNPILAGYVSRVWNQFGGQETCRLRLMTSGGNLATPSAFRGRDSVLSGPAGGVVALGHVAERAGVRSVIGLDMGGTSTDVSRFEGRVGRRYESQVAGVRVMTPMMDIETVAAGGGSICDVVDGRLVVGPASAGADPGPSCYGRGGPLTVTDVNLLLKRIPKDSFPFPLDHTAAENRLIEIQSKLSEQGVQIAQQELAEGFLRIAVTHMAEAIRTVTTAQGTDVRNMSLVGFGGAAGQHLCRVAEALGMTSILDHPDAGLLSALGMGLANIGRVVSQGVYQVLSEETLEALDETTLELKSCTDTQLKRDFTGESSSTFTLECEVRYVGTESSLSLPVHPKESLANRFHDKHQEVFGYSQRDRSIELVTVRCEATLESQYDRFTRDSAPAFEHSMAAFENHKALFWHQADWIEANVVDRNSLSIGDKIASPAMVVGPYSTLLVEPGWSGEVIDDQIIKLVPMPSSKFAKPKSENAREDPVLLEVMSRRFQGIADAMGEVLRRTSISVNVKERRDYSCAVFRSDGSLIANAPHVPVHLGAMGHTVQHLMKTFPQMSPGDCYLSNDPFAGGSHLPDVTAVTPVFCDRNVDSGKPDFFVGSRAHHAEIGGKTPGSMPPDATSLLEEGVLIRNFALVQRGEVHLDRLRELLSSGQYPSRSVEENIADVLAQQAAGVHGARALVELTENYSLDIVDALMARLLDVAGDSMQTWIQSLPCKPMTFVDALDDGTEIGVTMERHNEQLAIRFQNTDVHLNGFNATPAIVTAAVLYVLRCVSGSNLPLCDGVLRDVNLIVPQGLLNPPAHDDPSQCAAVVAGNVETSQRLVDVLLGALGVAAASQGTMNNVLMGDETFGYYETIGGGSGATRQHDGASAVHTHMTNTRITDSEVLETRLPVRLVRFSIRQRSGGEGTKRGGDGLIREFEFLKPLVISLITGRRSHGPYGLDAGASGQPGKNLLVNSSREQTPLPATCTIEVQPLDRLIIETPGGGGWRERENE